MMHKSTEQSLKSGGTLYRGIHGTLYRVFTGTHSRGLGGTLCAYSPLAAENRKISHFLDSVYTLVVAYALNLNDNVDPDDRLIAQNQKAVNHIYFTHDALNNHAYDEDDKTIIWNIASQCPFVGGNAVLEARKLLMNFSDSINWDDRETCGAAGYYKLLQHEAKPNTVAYAAPNPAKDNISILYSFNKDEIYRIEVYDIIGNIIYYRANIQNVHSASFSTVPFQNGSYHFIIRNCMNAVVASGRFIISR